MCVFAAGRGGFLDFEESFRSSKVLQGQENIGFVSPVYARDTANRPPFDRGSAGIKKAAPNEFAAAAYTGFAESSRFPKVLQGQEICQLSSLAAGRKTNFGLGGGPWAMAKPSIAPFNAYQASKPGFFPVATESLPSAYWVGPNPTTCPGENVNIPGKFKLQEKISALPALGTSATSPKEEGFKIFGFSLTGEPGVPHNPAAAKRSCTKVSHGNCAPGFYLTAFPTDR